MRINFTILAYFSGCVLAAPITLETRDTAVVVRAISNAQIALTKLATTVQIYTGKPNQNAKDQQIQIDEDSQAVTDVLSQGASQMKRGPMVTFAESTRVVGQINSLIMQLEKTVNAWVQAKSLIVSAGGRKPIWETLKRQQAAAVDFAQALIAKMPASTLAGAMYSSIVQAAYEKGIKAFS